TLPANDVKGYYLKFPINIDVIKNLTSFVLGNRID
ncbi:MAG: hypothetical protein ACJAU1_000456, partial [Psychromonas sp.]